MKHVVVIADEALLFDAQTMDAKSLRIQARRELILEHAASRF